MDRASIQERFGIVGSSSAIRNVIDRMRQVADTDITVLIQGESGVGKELIAEACHALSPRRHEPIVIVNCGAIPEGLMESELFGAEKGAYTGAVEKRKGYFEEADGGTIFLDEIGEMPASAQVRLLRVLENGEFSRVGSSTTHKTDVRIVAATNKNLAREVEAERFREDLYYRLSTVIINIPPLRERRDDVMPLFEHFVHHLSQKYNSPVRRLTEDARQLLREYRWPGNVRELRNVAEQVVVLLRSDEVTADDLRPYLRGVSAGQGSRSLMPVKRDEGSGDGTTREREFIYRALLELRMEMRELKDQVSQLASNISVAVPRQSGERDRPGRDQDDFVIVRNPTREDYAAIRDVPYELEEEERALPALRDHTESPELSGDAGRAAPPPASQSEPQEKEAGEQPIPTLEDAERQLIIQALKRFDGNRRQTAKALGISERTLYRKLKDVDEDL